MTQKTTGKVQPDRPNVGPSPEELQTAYQIHTLAQYLYGQVGLPLQQPWYPAMPSMGTYQTLPGIQPVPWQPYWPTMGAMQPWPTQGWTTPYAAQTQFPFGFQHFPR